MARTVRRIIVVLDAIAIGAVLVAGAVAGGVWTYARTTAGQARLARLAERALHDKVPGARLGGLGTTRARDIILTNVNLFDPGGVRAVHVDRLLVHPHWTALLHGQVDLEQVRVEGLTVDARTLPDGRINLAALVPSSPVPSARPGQTPGTGSAWAVRRFELVGASGELHRPDGVITVPALALSGHASAARGKTTFALEELRADLQLSGRPVAHLALTGNGVVDGKLIDATVGELRVSGLLPDDVVVHATVRKDHDVIESGGTARAAATGTASWSASVALAAGGLGAYDAVIAIDHLLLDRLPLGLPSGSLSARLSARGSGLPLRPGTTATVTARVLDSAVAGYRIEDATVHASSEGERWTLREGAMRVAGVSLHASGSGAGASGKAHVELNLDRLTARGAALAPSLPITGRGHLAATLEGRWPDELRFRLFGDVKGLAVAHQLSVETARVDVDGVATQRHGWSLTTRGRADVARLASAALSVNDAKLSFSTRGPLAAPSGALSARGSQLAFQPSGLRLDTAGVDAHGNAGDIVVAARAHGTDGDVDIQAYVRRRKDTLDLALARLGVDLHHKALRQKVMLANPATVHLQLAEDEVKIAGLHVVTQGTLASGEVLVDGDVKGPGRNHRAPSGHLVLELRHASALSVPSLDADVTVDVGGARARAALKVKQSKGDATLTGQLDVPLERTRTALGWKLATTGPLQATADSSNVELASIAPLQHALARWGLTGGNFHIHLAASGDMRDPQASLAVDVRRLEYRNVTGNGRDAHIHRVPGLGLSIDLGTAPKRLRATAKVFLYDGGFVTANVDWGVGLAGLLAGADLRQAPLDATVDLPRFQIAAFHSLSDQLQDTSGWLTGHGHITGPLARPRGTVDVTVADGRLDQIRLGLLAAHAEADGHAVHATLRLPTNGVRSGLLQARAALAIGPAPRVDATIDMTGVDPGFVRPLVPDLRELGGVVDAHVVVAGQWPKPALTGKLYYYGGRVGVVGEPTFTNVGLAVVLSPGHAELQSLQAYSGGGSMGPRVT